MTDSGQTAGSSLTGALFQAVQRALQQAQQHQQMMVERELLISTVARTFLDLPVTQLDIGIESALLAIGTTIGVDRVMLIQPGLAGLPPSISHQWCRDDLPEIRTGIPVPDIEAALSHQEPIVWHDESTAANAGALAQFGQMLGLGAGAACLLKNGTQVRGLLFVGAARREIWAEHDVYLIENLADILVSGIEQKRIEIALRDSEERFEKFINSIAPYVYVYAILANGEVEKLYNAPTVQQFLGYPLEYILNDFSFWLTLIHPDDAAIPEAMFARILQGESVQGEYRMRRSDGEYVWVEDVVRVEEGRGSRKYIVYGAINDITARRKADEVEAERQRLALALEAERALGEARNHFMLVVSHEFRTPLSVIMSSVDLLEQYFDRMPEQRRRDRLGAIRRQVELLSEMMDELAVVIRAEMGNLDFRPEPFDLVALCRQVRDELLGTVAENFTILVESPDGAPLAMLDPRLLRHIVSNLLGNAIKYSARGTTIRVTVSFSNDQITLSVSDQGRGIPSADQPAVFQPFVRGGNVQDTGGTGLGLKVVKDCAELHGGSVTFTSEVGRGTTFVVTLPYVPAPAV
jgi:PAS domain S-box-containing protein